MPTPVLRYQNESLFANISGGSTGYMFSSGNSGINFIKQFHRVQNVNSSISISRVDTNQLGQLARTDQIINESPAVTLGFSYYITNVANEQLLGFTVNNGASCISGILDGRTDDRNYFVSRSPYGQDDISFAGNSRTCRGFGNGVVSSYTAQGAVGGFATADVEITAFNFKGYNAASGTSPAIIPESGIPVSGPTFVVPTAISGLLGQPSAIRYGDMTVDISQANIIGESVSDLKIQNFNLNLGVGRDSLQKLGSLFPYARPLQVPVNASLSVSALVGDSSTGDLNSVFCNDTAIDITVNLYKPACPGSPREIAVQYLFKGAKLNSQGDSLSVGANGEINLEFSNQIGGPQDTSNGIFISGSLV